MGTATFDDASPAGAPAGGGRSVGHAVRAVARSAVGRPDRRASLAVAVVSLLAYLLASARYPVEWDGAQLTMALDRFDVADGTPHPPGYWLYVTAGRLVRAVTWLDGAAALTFVSAAAAAATVAVTHTLGRALGGRLVGALAAGLVATSPFLWFYASSVDTYTLDALAGVVLLALAVLARRGSAHGLAAAGVLGLAAGFRQTSLLLFAPLAVVAMARSARSVRAWVAGGAIGGLAVAAWALPMLVEQPGGLAAWRRASDALLAGSVDQTAVWAGTYEVVTRNMTQGSTYLVVALLPAAVVGAAAFLAGRDPAARARSGAPAGRPWLLPVLGAAPAVAFLVLVHFGKAGYVLAALPAAVLALAIPAGRLSGRAGRRVAAVGLAVCALSVQRILFAPGVVPEPLVDATPLPITSSVNGAPFPFTAAAVAESDRLARAQLALADAFDPDRDVLVWGWLNGGDRYRHATLLLPQFTTSFVRDSVHVHTARDGRWRTDPDTELEVPPGGRAVFVLDHSAPDLDRLLEAGQAQAVRLATGITVHVVRPGVTLLGVAIVEGDTRVGAGGT